MKVYEKDGFIVEAVEKPHVPREDGGHIKISPKERLIDRIDMTPEQAKNLMRLTMVVGEAMKIGMNNRGVDIGRINYQDNGNWSVFKPEGPYLHIHLYGRAKSAKVHKYGDACFFPHREEQPEYYERFEPLNEGDILEIKKQIEKIFKEDKYQDKNW